MRAGGWGAILALAIVALPADAQRPAQRRCVLELLSAEREGSGDRSIEGNESYFAAGNVRLKCRNQPIFLNGDSLESFGGQVIRVITRAQYRDEDITLDADTLLYVKASEMLQARGNVTIVNRVNGSTLVGPYLDYFRAVRGVRDSAETTALQRPTVTYQVARAQGDTVDPSPYVITADGLRGNGSSRLTGWGGVEVDRDSLRGRGDSLLYLSGEDDVVTLVGQPATLLRAGADSFRVRGRQVVLALDGEALRQVRALGDGHVLGATGEIVADSSALDFADGALVATRAWDRADGALVKAQGYDIRGDSVAIDTPEERLRELRVFGNGELLERPDSIAAPRDAPAADSTAVAEADSAEAFRNRMTGNRITVRFADHDSAGTVLTQVVDIVAIGTASSLFARDVERNGLVTPSINYTRADTIIVVMEVGDSSGVSEVRAYGSVDGVQLETASLRRRRIGLPTTPAVIPGRREEGP
jgi:hypothetical protein